MGNEHERGMPTKHSPRNIRLRVGWLTVLAIAVVFMIFSVIVVVTPLRGEEEYTGTTFSDIRSSNPQLANVIWHYTAAIGTIAFGTNLLIALLAWKGLSKGSRVAWYSTLLVAVTFAVSLVVAHVPIGHPSFEHWGPPVVLTAALLVGLAISAKPILSRSASQGPRERSLQAREGPE